MVKIYTKTGDKGKTSLFGGKRVSKADLRVEAYGTVDELNSLIGVVFAQDQRSKIKDQKYKLKIKSELMKIQNDLLKIGSILANPSFYFSSEAQAESRSNKNNSSLCQSADRTISALRNRVTDFENLIDELEKELPKLSNFILPGGGEVGSLLHFTRTVCRRAERRVVALQFNPSASLRARVQGSKFKVDESEMITYLNRLSDLLFVMARFVNFKEGKKEEIWNKTSI